MDVSEAEIYCHANGTKNKISRLTLSVENHTINPDQIQRKNLVGILLGFLLEKGFCS